MFLSMFTYIHNYIITLQCFRQDYDLALHTTYVVCFNFTHESRNLQLKVGSE